MAAVQIDLDVPTQLPEIPVPAQRTALLLVDLQNESCHPDGKNYHPECVSAVTATAALVERARDYRCPVLWLRSVRRADQPVFTVYGVAPYRLEGSWNVEITPPLKPAPDEPVFLKYSHDCFYDTGLDEYLAGQGIVAPDWTFVVAGVALAGCVYVAATGLSHRGYRTVIPMDCVAPRTGPRALMTMDRLAHRSYSYNTHLLASSAGLNFVA